MISQAAWHKYIKKLEAIDTKAADSMRSWVDANGLGDDNALIQYAYSLTTHYGEASATLSCDMYDTMSHMMKAGVPDAIPAETATYEEVAKGMMYGKYHSPSQIPDIVGRQVRQAGADTMIQNAARDNAEWAWVPEGDTCAFCLTLASNGWQPASKAVMNGNHADHIHQNCDCTFAIAFHPDDRKQYDNIYDADKYKEMYYGADGDTPDERINYLRRQNYEKNKDKINAQKREAYLQNQINTLARQLTDDHDIFVDVSKAKYPEAAKESLKHLETLVNEYDSTISSYQVGEALTGTVTEGGSAYMLNGKTSVTVLNKGMRVMKANDPMGLGDKQPLGVTYHEFAHTLSQSREKMTPDFWKEMRKLYKEYRSQINNPDWPNLKISSYANTDVDEFMAEAFTQAKLKDNPSEYALKALEIIDKYFKK